jgi:hypothetical protein
MVDEMELGEDEAIEEESNCIELSRGGDDESEKSWFYGDADGKISGYSD